MSVVTVLSREPSSGSGEGRRPAQRVAVRRVAEESARGMEQQRRCQRRVEGAIAHASRLERIEATGRYCEYTPPAPVNEEAIRAEAAAARALVQELTEPLGSA